MKNRFYNEWSLLLILFIVINNVFSQTTYIRTVVHVMYENVSQDITDGVVSNYINDVNKGFLKQLPAKFTRTPDVFGADWANTNIQLCLATIDPSGNASNGITHTLISDKFISSQVPLSPANPVWNPVNYLNIYLVPVYSEPGFPNFVLGGWASTPTEPQMGATFDYVVVSTNGIPFVPELITHEVGHFFGLKHLGDDNLADTPKGMEVITPTVGYASSCSSTLQTINSTSLLEDGNHWGGVDPPDMVENYMGLSFSCQFMFTNFQKSAMQNYINAHHASKIVSNCNINTELSQVNQVENFQFFPNPTRGLINIDLGDIINIYQIELLDVLGKRLILKNHNSGKLWLDISEYPNGVYFVKLFDNKNMNIIYKEIILIR